MSKETRVVHVMIVDGTKDEIRMISTELNKILEKLPFDMQFIVTNDRIQSQNAGNLLKDLYKLCKQLKKK